MTEVGCDKRLLTKLQQDKNLIGLFNLWQLEFYLFPPTSLQSDEQWYVIQGNTPVLIEENFPDEDQQFDLYFYEVDTGRETLAFVPTDYVDITDVHDRKMAAMMAHKTQSPEKIYERDFIPMEGFRGVEAGVKLAEAFIHFKPKSERSNIKGL